MQSVARVISTAAPTNGREVNYNANVSADKSTINANSAFVKALIIKLILMMEQAMRKGKVSKDNMIKYLCEAYYKINDDIVLGSSFAGLGGTSNSQGVIVGQAEIRRNISNYHQ